MWNLNWWDLAVRCFAFQGHFVLSTVWDGYYKVSLCQIPVHMYKCLQCPQAWQISTKAPFEADFRFPRFWPWQKYLGGRHQSAHHLSACGFLNLQVAVTTILATVHFWLAGKDSGAVRMSGAGGKGLIGTKRGWPTVHSPWLCADVGRNVGITEFQIQWFWFCSRIWT